jgi:hypothetical protein
MDWVSVSAVQWLKVLHTLIYFGGLSSFAIFFVVTVFALSPWPPRLRRRRHTDRTYAAMYSVCAPPTAHKRPNTHLLVTPCPQPARAPAHAPTGTCKGDTHMPLQVLAFLVRSIVLLDLTGPKSPLFDMAHAGIIPGPHKVG